MNSAACLVAVYDAETLTSTAPVVGEIVSVPSELLTEVIIPSPPLTKGVDILTLIVQFFPNSGHL